MNEQQDVLTTILSDSSGLLGILIGIILVLALVTIAWCEITKWVHIRLICRRRGHAWTSVGRCMRCGHKAAE